MKDSARFLDRYTFFKNGSKVSKKVLFQRFAKYCNTKRCSETDAMLTALLERRGVESDASSYLDIELVSEDFYKKYDIHRLFKEIPRTTRIALQFDIEGLFSVTSYILSKRIAKMIRQLPHIHEPATIIDANASCGGNTFAFSTDFDHVLAIEIHKERYKMLRHNLQVMGITNVDMLNRDCIPYLYKKRKFVDCIFFDPPWGGEAYKEKREIHLYLNHEDIIEISRKLLEKRKCTYIIIKAPNNIHREAFSVFQKITYIEYFHKFLIIILSNI